MKMFENIASGYKKIAASIAIVAFLAIMYFALIPGGTVAASSSVMSALSGTPIVGAFVKIVEWPQYNATTDSNGNYTMPNVPYGTYTISAQAPGYTKNVSTVNVSSSTVTKDFSLYSGSVTGEYRYLQPIDNELTSNKISTLSDVGINFSIPSYGDHVGWETVVYVTDYSGLGTTLTIDYYYDNGTYAKTEIQPLSANGTYVWTPSDNTNNRPTQGKLIIKATNNIVGEFKIYSKSTTDMFSTKLYTSADVGTSFTIPQYGDHIGWDTFVAISDVSGLGANLTLNYYYNNGTPAKTEYPNLTANATYLDIISNSLNGRPTQGKLEIRSNRAVVGEYRIYSLGTAGIMSSKLYTSDDKKTTFNIPQYGDHIGWDTFVAIADVSGIGANVTIDYIYPNGSHAMTEIMTLSANELKYFIPSDGTNNRPTMGKLMISSDNIITGEMRIYSLSGRGIMSNSLFNQKDVSRTVVLPYYGNNVNLSTFLILADVSGYDTVARLEYHYLNGTLAKTELVTIPADGLGYWMVSDGTNGRPTEGNVFIYT